MKLRDGNIIVCDCGAELNPEITTPTDYIKFDKVTSTATCSKCLASGVITFPVPPVEPVYDGPTVEGLDATLTDLVQVLVDKGVIY